MQTISVHSCRATAKAVNQWLPSPVFIVPPSDSTEANRKGHMVSEANGRLGGGRHWLQPRRSAVWASVSVTLVPKSPGPALPGSCCPRPYFGPAFKLPAPRQSRRPPPNLCSSKAPTLRQLDSESPAGSLLRGEKARRRDAASDLRRAGAGWGWALAWAWRLGSWGCEVRL